MKWSWKLTRIAGIDVYVHATFFMLIAWIALSYWQMEGSMVGVLTQTDLLKRLQARGGGHARVGDWMQREVQSAEIDESVEKVLERLQNSQCRLLPVTEAGRLAGIVNLDNIMELINIQTTLLGRNRSVARRRLSGGGTP